MSSDPRKSRAHRALAASMRGLQPCVYCRQEIDDDLPYPHPGSRVVAHDVAVALDPDAALDPGNAWPAHQLCNQRAGIAPITGPADPRLFGGGRSMGDLAWAIYQHTLDRGSTDHAALCAALPYVNPATLRRHLSSMTRRGMLIRVTAGIYQAVPIPTHSAHAAPAIHIDPATMQ